MSALFGNMYSVYIIIFATIFSPQIVNNFSSYFSEKKCSLLKSECLTTFMRDNLHIIINGIPELGIEKLDRMAIDYGSVEKDGLHYEIKKVQVSGLKNAVIDNIWVDTTWNYINLSLRTTFNVDCEYKGSGSLLLVPFSGTGRKHVVKKNVIIDILWLFDIEKKENMKKIINLKSFRYGYTVQNGTVYRHKNLFNGDKAKSDLLQVFFDKNWRIIEKSFAGFFFEIVNMRIFRALKIYLQQFPFEDEDHNNNNNTIFNNLSVYSLQLLLFIITVKAISSNSSLNFKQAIFRKFWKKSQVEK